MNTDKSQQVQSKSGKAGRRISKLSVIIYVLVLLVIGVFLYVSFTSSGQVMMGDILNKGFSNWLFGESDPQAEKAMAEELRKSGALVIEEQGKGVTSVDFSGCPKLTDEELKLIAKLRQLSTANFLNTEISDDQLTYLSNSNHLANLVVNSTPITDAGLTHLTNLPDLHALYICYTKITDNGIGEIAKFKTLTDLNLSGNDITDKGMKQIAKMPELQWLLIQSTKVTDAGLSELASLPQLKRLSISKDMNISNEAIQKLKTAIPKLQVDINKPEPRPAKPAADDALPTNSPPNAETVK
jgi:Leucine Rich repeat